MKEFSLFPTRKILDALACPDDGLKIIHIAGTNGKGSTARFFTNILVAAGKKVGTFTSPQVYSYYDQFRIDGKIIASEVFDGYRAEAKKYSCGASEFEIDTAAAIYAFYKEGCEYAVIECGMGGLFDATNAVKEKVLAVIASISLEHTQYLGNTLESICRHKAGIIKNCPAIINAYQSETVKEYFKGCKFADKTDKIYDGGFVYDGTDYKVRALGSLQAYNAACAIEGARLLGIDEKYIKEGIEAFSPCGAMDEFIVEGRRYILDGAHNPAAFVPLAEYMSRHICSRTVIFSCLNDKDIDGNLSSIKADKIIAVGSFGERAMSKEEVARHCKKYFKNTLTAESVSAALDIADGEEVIVCGSFTILKEAKQWIDKRQ